MGYTGIDVSHHQGKIDWRLVKASGMAFAMIRACYGWDNDSQIDKKLNDSQIDKKLVENAAGCDAVGLPYGLYHYSYAHTPDEARCEANFLLRVIKEKGLKPLYPVAFDFEEASQVGGSDKYGKHNRGLSEDEQINIITTFLNTVEGKGYYVSLYMTASAMQKLYQHNSEGLRPYDHWVAHVNVAKPNFDGPYGMWQFSWEEKVFGIAGKVDVNHAYKNYPEIIKSKKLNGF